VTAQDREMLGISPETVQLHLLRIGYILKALHWVPHILTDNLKRIRFEMCQTMLSATRVQDHNQWNNTVTGDESWFYFEYLRDCLWISSFDNTPHYSNRIMATEKHILTVFWNPRIPGRDNSPDRGIVQRGLVYIWKPRAITRLFLSGGKAIWSEKVDGSYRPCKSTYRTSDPKLCYTQRAP
jgi:hypothetical protein